MPFGSAVSVRRHESGLVSVFPLVGKPVCWGRPDYRTAVSAGGIQWADCGRIHQAGVNAKKDPIDLTIGMLRLSFQIVTGLAGPSLKHLELLD